jgi:hypothetical protein
MFVISYHALFLPPEVIDEEHFAFKITFLFSYSSNNTTLSLSFRFVSISFRTLQVPIDNARFYYFVRIDIQGRVCLNVTIRDCWK